MFQTLRKGLYESEKNEGVWVLDSMENGNSVVQATSEARDAVKGDEFVDNESERRDQF